MSTNTCKTVLPSELEFLLKKYDALGYAHIRGFVRAEKSLLPEETWGKTLNRHENPSVETLMVMCAELDCTARELGKLLLDRKDKKLDLIVEKWIDPLR